MAAPGRRKSGRDRLGQGGGVANPPVLEGPALRNPQAIGVVGAQVVAHGVGLGIEALDPGRAVAVVVGEGGGGTGVATRLGAGAAAHGGDANDVVSRVRGSHRQLSGPLAVVRVDRAVSWRHEP